MLDLLAQASTMLQNTTRPLAARVKDLFGLLHMGIRYQDARLTCWYHSARPGSRHQQFYSIEPPLRPWNNTLMREIALEGKIARRSLSSGSVNDTRKTPPDGVLAKPATTYLGAPIIWSNKLWGVLELRSSNSDDLNTHEQELIAALLPQLAVAIVREGGHQDQDANVHILSATPNAPTETAHHTTLSHDSRIIALEHELQEPIALHTMLTMLLRLTLEETGAEAGAICLVDHKRGELVLQVHQGYTSDIFITDPRGIQQQRWSWEHGLAGRVARSGRALLVRDVSNESSLRPIASHIQAELAAPITFNDTVLAVLLLDSPRSAAFGDAELAFVTTLCSHAAQSIYRALRYQEIFEASTQLSQVFNGLPTGLALLDISGLVLRTNPAWSTTWGLAEHTGDAPFHVPLDLVDQLLARLQDPMDIITFCDNVQNTPKEVHMMHIPLNNPARELQVLVAPTYDSKGRMTGQLWMVNDVTREREVDRLKDEFVSVVSHELRTPLTSILGFTELLLVREFTPSEQKRFIQTVYDEATRLSKLVEDLLSFSRLEAGKVKLHSWMASMNHVIREIANQLTEFERHRLLIHLDEPLPPVYIDRDKVKQILHNLISNAIKYSPKGGEVALSVHAVSTDAPDQHDYGLPEDHPPGTWVMVRVRDQGIGIAAEDLLYIWDRFYRVDNTNTRRIGGTGIGLSIARSLVELHGGRIWAESEPGVGSTFSFTLPVATDMV